MSKIEVIARAADERDGSENGATRREFLTGLGASAVALGATALLPSSAWSRPAKPQGAASSAKPAIIDVHHHYGSPGWMDEIFNKRKVGNATMSRWTPQVSLDEMDKAGVSVAMLSPTRPGIWFGWKDLETSKRLARDMNDYGAKLVADHPKRFGLFAVLPLPDVEGSLKEIAYAFDTLKVDGIAVMSNYDDIYLGDPKIAPVMDELNRRKAIVFEHPVREDRDNPFNGIELITETTRTIQSLLYNGTVVRCPDIRFVWSHGGGTMPMAASRLGVPQGKLPKGVMFELQKMYYDCAGITTNYQLAAVKAFVQPSHFLFGTDYPLGGIGSTDMGLRQNGGYSEAELRAIEHDNVLALLPRLKNI